MTHYEIAREMKAKGHDKKFPKTYAAHLKYLTDDERERLDAANSHRAVTL